MPDDKFPQDHSILLAEYWDRGYTASRVGSDRTLITVYAPDDSYLGEATSPQMADQMARLHLIHTRVDDLYKALKPSAPTEALAAEATLTFRLTASEARRIRESIGEVYRTLAVHKSSSERFSLEVIVMRLLTMMEVAGLHEQLKGADDGKEP